MPKKDIPPSVKAAAKETNDRLAARGTADDSVWALDTSMMSLTGPPLDTAMMSLTKELVQQRRFRALQISLEGYGNYLEAHPEVWDVMPTPQPTEWVMTYRVGHKLAG